LIRLNPYIVTVVTIVLKALLLRSHALWAIIRMTIAVALKLLVFRVLLEFIRMILRRTNASHVLQDLCALAEPLTQLLFQ